jgi:hypothetical protein
MTDTWIFNSDGSADFSGTVHFPAGSNIASGAGVVVFGPNGAVASFPAIFKGDPGDAPTVTWTMSQVAYGSSLPSTNPVVVFTPASGLTPPNYDLTFYVNAGSPGASAANTLISPQPSDLDGSPADGYLIGYSSSLSEAQWQPIPVGNYYFDGSISATSSNTNAVKNLSSIAIASQPFDWWPEISAATNVIGASDTRVDLVARIGSTSGTICGYGYGQAGSSPPPVSAGPYGLAVGAGTIISAGSGATIYLNAENQTSSANPWNTTSSSFFQVKVVSVP